VHTCLPRHSFCICACMYQPPECSASSMGIPWHVWHHGCCKERKEAYEVLLPVQGLSTGVQAHCLSVGSFARAQACWCRMLAGLVKHLALTSHSKMGLVFHASPLSTATVFDGWRGMGWVLNNAAGCRCMVTG
jgi:hypothetical protein